MNTRMSFRVFNLALAMVAIVAVFAASEISAQVQPVDLCKAHIDSVMADLVSIYKSGGIGGGNPDKTYSGLLSKLDGAKDKLNQKKYSDAKQKLQDFKDAVTLMRDATKPKLSKEVAALLLYGDGDDPDTGVNGALECVCLLE